MQFNHQALTATLVNGIPHVALKPICHQLDLDWDSQRQKIKRHPVLSQGMVMITTPSKGGNQEMLMLPLSYLNGWLFGIDANRVKPEAKEAVLMYQRECFNVLAAHFMPKQYGLKEMPADMTLVEKSFVSKMEAELKELIEFKQQTLKKREALLPFHEWLNFAMDKGFYILNLHENDNELLDLLYERGYEVVNPVTHKSVPKSVLNVIKDLLVL